jgi:signal peptidase I
MNGSGARDGFGTPPWGPADPVPELDDTQVLPGPGGARGPGDGPVRQERGYGYGDGYGATARPGGSWPRPPGYDDRAQQAALRRDDSAQWHPNGSQRPRSQGPGSQRPNSQGPGSQGPGSQWPGSQQPGSQWPGSQQPGSQWPGSQRPASPDPGGPGGGRPGGPGSGPGSGPNPDVDPKTESGQRRRRSFWRELPVLVVVALVLALVIKSFAVQAFYIPSASMQNTLAIGDRVLINKIVYHLRSIHRGDIVVFDGSTSWDAATQRPGGNFLTKAADELEGIVGISHDSSIYIKRVIGLPGDTVKCCNAKRQITVNGVALSESSYLYPDNAPSTTKFREVVPPDSLWVMGDHRAVSFDSRGHTGDPGGGAIPVSAVLGRAFVIIWPPSRWGFLNIPATFEQPQLNASKAAGGQAAAGGSATVLDSAMANGTPLQPAYSSLPLVLGLAGAVPITWLQRRVRQRKRSA